MSDRREELLRQREAIKAHLAWLDREIEATAGPVPAAPALPEESGSGLKLVERVVIEKIPEIEPTVPDPDRQPVTDVEAILDEYRQPTMSIANQTKMGCILYFVLGMAVLALAATACYFGFKWKRGL